MRPGFRGHPFKVLQGPGQRFDESRPCYVYPIYAIPTPNSQPFIIILMLKLFCAVLPYLCMIIEFHCGPLCHFAFEQRLESPPPGNEHIPLCTAAKIYLHVNLKLKNVPMEHFWREFSPHSVVYGLNLELTMVNHFAKIV